MVQIQKSADFHQRILRLMRVFITDLPVSVISYLFCREDSP